MELWRSLPPEVLAANASWLELATIACNLSCVVGKFTDPDVDTARSARLSYPRQTYSNHGTNINLGEKTGFAPSRPPENTDRT